MKGKLLLYEMKRLMLGKVYAGLAVIIGLFAWQMLTGDIIRGIGYTAPFSGWSYGYYLASLAPLLSVTLLFFLTFLYTPAERRAANITGATPTDPREHLAIRYAAMAVGYLALCLLVIALGHVFYARFFKLNTFGDFLLPTLLTLVPCFLLTLGVGAVAGRVHVGILYALMLLCVLLTQVSLPGYLDFTGAAYFGGVPVTLPAGPDGEPAFVAQAGFVLSRAALSGVGMVCLAASFMPGGGRGLKKGSRRAILSAMGE